MAGCWARIADEVAAFAQREGVATRDLVVLLPFAQHLPLARAAWSARAAAQWMPRFETTRTLAESLAPPRAPDDGAPTFDAATDRLLVARMLGGSAPDWPQRDARGFDLAVRRVVDLSHALARARAARPPAERSAWTAAARERLAGTGGPAQAERSLARLALEWSLAAATDAADALFAYRPAAWVALRVGAREALTEALLCASGVPALWLDADLPLASSPDGRVTVAACDDFEDEAQRTAATVLEHLRRGDAEAAPVALIALDRVLVRRVRALLARAGVPLADETGWKLSTTRAAARVLALLRSAGPRAEVDEVVDLLKSLPDTTGVDALESALRAAGRALVVEIDAERLPDAAHPAWQRWLAMSDPLRAAGRDTLAGWLARLAEALRRGGLIDELSADAAGVQVLAALRCDLGRQDVGFLAIASATRFQAGAFVAWVDGVLEQAPFRPPEDAAAQVVVMPLARAALRPFGAIVCPGTDAGHLGAGAAPEPLLGDALAIALGLPGVATQRDAERFAFAQLAREPRLTLLHRRGDGREPMTASPLLRRWQLAAARAGRPLATAADPRVQRRLQPRPTPRPRPAAPALLPDRLSASRYEHLRACPYRFYAAAMLRLEEVEELDDELEKRDAGTWLHAVLQRFHAERSATADTEADVERLLVIAAEDAQRHFGSGPAAADFLPYAAWFEGLAPAYIDWLHAAEAEGWAVQASELDLRAPLAIGDREPLTLQSRLDRVDGRRVVGGDEAGSHRRLIDYKLRGKGALQTQVRVPLEDTQLAFYAALLGAAEGWPDGGLEAGYLALDGRDGVAWVAHPDVADSAQALVDGLGSDIARLRAGAPLPALGEGAACDHCAARGLCRRDFWEPSR
ncbi:PD-(D/E)XK nuclease family protein [uncultured Methylibium sp.]|uniref:PD-(D/E)XK nuclease family protein n=1 Tax=uncultured Methylibium sp. TaxID=381093 RepID=UPI0025DCF6AE|nr:PD-(D/E)XK nuclease family protein [uncultured Methylibium sp.]